MFVCVLFWWGRAGLVLVFICGFDPFQDDDEMAADQGLDAEGEGCETDSDLSSSTASLDLAKVQAVVSILQKREAKKILEEPKSKSLPMVSDKARVYILGWSSQPCLP